MEKSKKSVHLFNARIRDGRDLAIAVTEGINGLENASTEQKFYMIQGVANGLNIAAAILRDHPEEAERCPDVFADAARGIMQAFAAFSAGDNDEDEENDWPA